MTRLVRLWGRVMGRVLDRVRDRVVERRRERATLGRMRTHCALGIHRDTIESASGSILHARCVDCHRTEALGWIVRGSNTRPRHSTWRPDDA